MKKQIFILLILFITVCGIIGAQEATGKTAYYAKSVLIYKVYSHSMGFKVVYHKPVLSRAFSIYLFRGSETRLEKARLFMETTGRILFYSIL